MIKLKLILVAGAVQERPGDFEDHSSSEERDRGPVTSQTPPHPASLLVLPGPTAHLHSAGVCQQGGVVQVSQTAGKVHSGTDCQGE